MAINSFRAYAKRICYLPIILTARQTLQNFQLTLGQLLVIALLLYDRLRIRRNHTLSTGNCKNAFANVFGGTIFKKQTVYSRIVKLLTKRGGRNAGNNHKFSIRRPAFAFNVNLKAVGPRHVKVQKRAVGFKPFNHRNRFDSIRRHCDNLKPWHGLKRSLYALCRKRMIFCYYDCMCHRASYLVLRPKSKLKQIIISLFTGLLCFTPLAAADTSAAEVLDGTLDVRYIPAHGPLSVKELPAQIDYYLDVDWSKTAAQMAAEDSQLFKPLDAQHINFGYTSNRIWLRMGIENLMDDNTNWRLHFIENFFQNFDVYLIRQTQDAHLRPIEHIVALDQNSKFNERPISFPELVTPLDIATGEKVTVLVAYWSQGSSQVDIALETADSFSTVAVSRMAKSYTSYGMMVILIIAASIAFGFLRHFLYLAYIAYAVTILLFLLHADGVGFQYLWPNLPNFNAIASVFFGAGVIISCAYYSRIILRTKTHHPFVDKVLFGLVICVSVLTLAGLLISPQLLKQNLICLAFVGIMLCIWAGLVAAQTRFKEVRFYILAWIGAIISVGIMNMRHVFGFGIEQDIELHSIRVTMVFDAVMMGLAIADRYSHMRKSRQHAMEENLAEAERNLELNSRLYDLEDQYKLAVDLVQSRDEYLKNTVHDLRQPLHALRLNIEKLKHAKAANRANETDSRNIDETFSYLEALIADHLKNSVSPENLNAPPRRPHTLSQFDDSPLDVPAVLKSIHEMFLPDAIDKGLDFEYSAKGYDAKIDPLVLMRIMTNLVSNAIKYTDKGAIQLTTRKSKKALRIELRDTGSGMSDEEFKTAQNREVRLPENQNVIEGNGYGLTIVRGLVQKHNLKLYLAPSKHRGTRIILEIPDAL